LAGFYKASGTPALPVLQAKPPSYIGLYSGVTAGGALIGSLTGETLKEVDFIFNNASGAIATVELIPEPTSALLFASAVGFLFLHRRRQS